MTKSEYNYLYEIQTSARSDGKVRVAEIAKRLGVSNVSVYKAMDKLRKNGYIVAEGKYATLTEKGGSALLEYGKIVQYVAERLKERCALTEKEAKNDAIGIACALSEKSKRAIAADL